MKEPFEITLYNKNSLSAGILSQAPNHLGYYPITNLLSRQCSPHIVQTHKQ